MISFSQTALEFAREVLGFEDAALVCGRICIIKGTLERFDHLDLNAVMKAVEAFCSEHDLFVSCCRSPGLSTWQATIFRHGLETSLGIDYPTLAEAILSACLEAARKLKVA